MSLLFPGLTETFHGYGFILAVPPENIVAARLRDLSGAILGPNATESQYQEAVNDANEVWGVFPPEWLVKYAPALDRYNEVYAKTGFKYSSGPKVTIIGTFANSSRGPSQMDLAYRISSLLSVPFVIL